MIMGFQYKFRPGFLKFGYAMWTSRVTVTESIIYERHKIIWDLYENVNPDCETDHQPASLDYVIHLFPKTYLNLIQLPHVLKILWWQVGVTTSGRLHCLPSCHDSCHEGKNSPSMDKNEILVQTCIICHGWVREKLLRINHKEASGFLRGCKRSDAQKDKNLHERLSLVISKRSS